MKNFVPVFFLECCSGLYDVEGYEPLGSLISNTHYFIFIFFHLNKNWLIKNNGAIEEAHTMHY